jgi:hypothetical protein
MHNGLRTLSFLIAVVSLTSAESSRAGMRGALTLGVGRTSLRDNLRHTGPRGMTTLTADVLFLAPEAPLAFLVGGAFGLPTDYSSPSEDQPSEQRASYLDIALGAFTRPLSRVALYAGLGASTLIDLKMRQSSPGIPDEFHAPSTLGPLLVAGIVLAPIDDLAIAISARHRRLRSYYTYSAGDVELTHDVEADGMQLSLCVGVPLGWTEGKK